MSVSPLERRWLRSPGAAVVRLLPADRRPGPVPLSCAAV